MRMLFAGMLAFSTLPVHAEPSQDWSAAIARDGLAKTEAVIAALPAPSGDDLFALGGVRFLMAVEQAMQLRWQVGATGMLAPLPLLQVELLPNPAPEAARASLVSEIMIGATARLDQAEAALAAIPATSDVGLVIRLEDLWFDIDGNGQRRNRFEDLLPIALAAFTNPWERKPRPLSTTIRFDTADVAWLRAYGHLISGVASFILAFDPTDAAAKVMAATDERRRRLASPLPSLIERYDPEGGLDKATIAVFALRQRPDADLTRQTATHLRQMIVLNRQFWALLAAETDNEAEWIPNGQQQAALGFVLPPDIGKVWSAVLGDLELMLAGKLLVPHVAFPPEAGIDIAAFLQNPAPVDLLGWLQGIDALPYAERGPVVTALAWRAFEQLVSGRGMMVALLLN